ncbi:hypothetical protein [Pandoraea sputorum]|uniref:hypothetical protein n=1 Tax=Pandoraea sputorum TaxID=93222 RepID=UPI00123F96B1|nr:hypothetical protein [Pandoraea sputorum]VVE55381.1 hypothetical protein PSP20601_04982 [Pandoraea sputorum]
MAINGTHKSYATNTVISQVLRKEVNLDQVKNIDLVCRNVAEHYLRPDSEGKSTIVLTINGNAIKMPEASVSGAGANGPTNVHQLEADGREVLRDVVKEIGKALVDADVPQDVADQQAELIASQLGQKGLLEVDKALREASTTHRVYQQGLNVIIEPGKVRFEKITTLVAAPKSALPDAAPAQASPQQDALQEASERVRGEATGGVEPGVSLERVTTVAVEFVVRQATREESSSGVVRRFGDGWIIEAGVADVAVWQCNAKEGANELTRELMQPATSGWQAMLDLFRTLGAWLRGQGIVFNERGSGPAHDGKPPILASLAGMEQFRRREAAEVFARRSPGGWGNRTAEYRLRPAKLSIGDGDHRPVASGPGTVTRDKQPVRVSQQLGNATHEVARRDAFLSGSSTVAEANKTRYDKAGWLAVTHKISPEHFEFADREMRDTAREASTAQMEKRLDLVKKDLGRTLKAHGLHYIKLDGVSIAGQVFHGAYTHLNVWKRATAKASSVRKPAPLMPAALKTVCTQLNLSCATPDELETELAKLAVDAAINNIEDKFTDLTLRRRMYIVVTQTFDSTMAPFEQGYAAPILPDAGEKRTLDIVSVRNEPDNYTVSYSRTRTLKDEHGEGFVTTGDSVLMNVKSASSCVSSTWRMSPATLEMTSGTITVSVQGDKAKIEEARKQAERDAQDAADYDAWQADSGINGDVA